MTRWLLTGLSCYQRTEVLCYGPGVHAQRRTSAKFPSDTVRLTVNGTCPKETRRNVGSPGIHSEGRGALYDVLVKIALVRARKRRNYNLTAAHFDTSFLRIKMSGCYVSHTCLDRHIAFQSFAERHRRRTPSRTRFRSGCRMAEPAADTCGSCRPSARQGRQASCLRPWRRRASLPAADSGALQSCCPSP